MVKRKLDQVAEHDSPDSPIIRLPLAELSPSKINSLEPRSKPNPGGSSKLAWFNPLCDDPRLSSVRDNLFAKISKREPSTNGHSECVKVVGFDESSRPVADKDVLTLFKSICPDAPARYSPYVISMAQAGKKIPELSPPSYPSELRKVKQKRVKTAEGGNEKEATWVASHLCHNRECVNPSHLVWEPSWFNRLRDNCSGGTLCWHRPDPCLRAHRSDQEIVDWTEYVQDVSRSA